jgi:hypothetical protein
MVSSMQDFAIGSGRLLPTLAAAVALLGAVLGAWSWFGAGRNKAMIAIVLGAIGAAIGMLHAMNAGGGVGTGNGLAGAIAAIALGFVAMAFGAAQLRSSKK